MYFLTWHRGLIPCVAALVVTAAAISPNKQPPDSFEIFHCEAPLWDHSRGPQWQEFYQAGKLRERLICDADIEEYDVKEQALVLTAEASKRIPRVYHRFAVVLGGKRIYGGIVLDRMSPMGTQHPVIYSEQEADRTILFLRPSTTIYDVPRLSDPSWNVMCVDAMKAHFKDKLRVPERSPVKFVNARLSSTGW